MFFKNRKLIIYFYSLFLVCFLCVNISGCALLSPIKEIRTRAHIEDESSNWRITHGSLYGQLETDLLTSRDMKIQVNDFRHGNGEYFEILIEFEEVSINSLNFSPSDVTVKLSNGELLKAKGIDCADVNLNSTLHDKQRLPILENPIPIVIGSCYYLFFNHPAPPDEEEVVMYMNDALMSNSKNIDVPPIYFRKTIKNIYRSGCIM